MVGWSTLVRSNALIESGAFSCCCWRFLLFFFRSSSLSCYVRSMAGTEPKTRRCNSKVTRTQRKTRKISSCFVLSVGELHFRVGFFAPFFALGLFSGRPCQCGWCMFLLRTRNLYAFSFLSIEFFFFSFFLLSTSPQFVITTTENCRSRKKKAHTLPHRLCYYTPYARVGWNVGTICHP